MIVLLLPDRRDGEPPANAAANASDPARSSGRLRVLIVEDDFLVAMLLEEAVRAAGMDIVGVVGTRAEALDVARTQQPDLVTMDINLQGGGSGIEAAIDIRRQFDIPSIFVTAYTDDEHIRRAEPADPAGWLAKPFSEAQLVEVLKSCARRLAN